jgi:hypothetical protein
MLRLVALLLALAYITSAFIRSDAAAGLEMMMYCALPVACIWFPEELADFVGGQITMPSPPRFVLVFGWILLLIPSLERSLWYFGGGRSWLF